MPLIHHPSRASLLGMGVFPSLCHCTWFRSRLTTCVLPWLFLTAVVAALHPLRVP